jgi:hypothetical protein
MITAEEVVRSLPVLLKEHPALRMELFGILSEEFVGRSEFYEYMKKSDERFERLLQELRAFREDTNRRFEAADKKFEEMREDSNRRFEAVDKRFDKVDSDAKDLKDWVGVVVGGFQRRAGRSLEDAVAGTLRIALGKDVKPESIVLRKKIKDDEGMIGRPGRSYEIDLCLTNEECLVFEIKSYAKPDEIENFNEKAELVKKKLGLKKVVKALITLEKHPSVVKQCDKLGILVG